MGFKGLHVGQPLLGLAQPDSQRNQGRGTLVSRSVVVLSVPHQLQGPGFQMYVHDPAYAELVEVLVRDGVDFVFEEAAGHGPSIAENLAASILGPDHYLDIDPPRDDRHKYGIAADTEEWVPIDPWNSTAMCSRVSVKDQGKREELWLERIRTQQFEKGLVVCGIAHGLSFGFRLMAAGFNDNRVYSYIPFDKLCSRPHGEKA